MALETRALPYDPELEAALPKLPEIFAGMIAGSPEAAVDGHDVECLERTVPGPSGAPDVAVAIVRPRGEVNDAPIYFAIHGGGMVRGNRFMGLPVAVVEQHGVVAVSPEYRLAPDNPHPAIIEDCYAALVWTHEHAVELGGDPNRIVVGGGSAGGGLAAALALLARDRSGPPIMAQYLGSPMLEDRSDSCSMEQFDEPGLFGRSTNIASWSAVLGDAAGGPDVEPYAAAARATDLSGLPPACIVAGSSEPLRDPCVQYASRLWAAGVQAELHVWAGGFHGFSLVPGVRIAEAANAASDSWFERIFAS